MKFSSEFTSLLSAKVRVILCLSAPGAVKLGFAPWLSNKLTSSEEVTTSCKALNPIYVLALSEYWDIIFDKSWVKTKCPAT